MKQNDTNGTFCLITSSTERFGTASNNSGRKTAVVEGGLAERNRMKQRESFWQRAETQPLCSPGFPR